MAYVKENEHCTRIAEEIAEAFESGKKSVVLSAPTGSQKSGIAWFTHLKTRMNAAVLSHQKILQDQYTELLDDGNPKNFTTLKGRANYKCLINPKISADIAPCAFQKKPTCKHYKDKTCTWYKTKMEGEQTGFLNCNYQFVWNMRDNQTEFTFNKELYVYDEAHNIHQLYTDFRSPKISEQDLRFYTRQLDWAEEHDKPNLAYYAKKLIDEIKSIDFRQKNDDDYLLAKMETIFNYKNENSEALARYIKDHDPEVFETGHIKILGALDKFECRSKMTYNILKERRPDMDNCIVELNQGDKGMFNLTLTGFDIAKQFAQEANLFSDYKLFMSATILGAKNFLKNLGYSPEYSHIIEMPSRFPVANRQVHILPGQSINYALMQDPAKLKFSLSMLTDLVQRKIDDGHSGVIFTSSYDLTKIVTNHLRMKLDESKVDLLFNMEAKQREEVLEEFKTPGNRPKLLVSCSYFEGVNLAADICRYSVIFKVPYASLGSKYVKAVMEQNNELYQIWALTDIVQAVGRGVRSEDDWCEAFILDGNAQRLFKYGKKFVPKWFWDSLNWVN